MNPILFIGVFVFVCCLLFGLILFSIQLVNDFINYRAPFFLVLLFVIWSIIFIFTGLAIGDKL